MRLPSGERRQAIVTAVKGAFADKGFDGTTTRELARAAGVSEALLYKHFPSKESLYVAMLEACADGPMASGVHPRPRAPALDVDAGRRWCTS